MAKAKHTYTLPELEYLEKKVDEYIQFLEARPVHELEDRMAYKTTANGGSIPTIIATIEAQFAANIKAMEQLTKLLPQLEEMRKGAADVVEIRGGQGQLPSRVERLLLNSDSSSA
ncbi:hypothetical protein GCM10028806_34420 [Spirosoma terrae]|uniref:Uncharacterized protein n=1 Tax=Spirosoma terrae TaxID=1968276 RepID=A0A6L9L5D1_9BACT|nr:hypothetical protein [Spirosoma terrae]NDU95756.1 hypothetical protein [Spirosoma terrae]